MGNSLGSGSPRGNGDGSYNDVYGYNSGGTTQSGQPPHLVKGGNVTEQKGFGGGGKPAKAGIWYGGNSNSANSISNGNNENNNTASKIETYGNTNKIKAGSEGIVGGNIYENVNGVGLIKLGKVRTPAVVTTSAGGNTASTDKPSVTSLNPSHTEGNATGKTVAPPSGNISGTNATGYTGTPAVVTTSAGGNTASESKGTKTKAPNPETKIPTPDDKGVPTP
ncbi:MAG: hypothetical protein ACYCT6_08885 [bacterium]